jgi:hypothetical protein
VLGQYWSKYPTGTVHVAVVDPGVGTDRAALLVEADDQFILAPDNGLLTWALREARHVRLAVLKPDVHRPGEVSATFHGRDVFAYAAGLLAGGRANAGQLADPVNEITVPLWGMVQAAPDRITGEIVHIDRFGNLITNISRHQVVEMKWREYVAQTGLLTSIAVRRTYGEVAQGELLALYGASDMLEIAVSAGSAAKQTGLTRGAAVTVRKRE